MKYSRLINPVRDNSSNQQKQQEQVDEARKADNQKSKQ